MADNQLIYVRQSGLITTYACSITRLAPAATATDILTLFGDGTKLIKLKRVILSGGATAAGSMDLFFQRRTAATTGGTKTSPTPIPLSLKPATGNADGVLTTPPVAVGVVNFYTVEPTPGANFGGAANAIRIVTMALPPIGAPTFASLLDVKFGENGEQDFEFTKTAAGFALNNNGAAILGGTLLSVTVIWTEE